MTELLCGYAKSTQERVFSVWAEEIPEAETRLKTRTQHFCAHALLGDVLSEEYGLHHVRIHRQGIEKPTLIHDFLHMNLSHCKRMAIAAVGNCPLGADIETPRNVKPTHLPRLLTADERAFLDAQPEMCKSFVFARFWTLKEAYAKFTGEGIRRPFGSLGFTLGEKIGFCSPDADRLRFFQLIRGFELVVSLCVPAGEYTLSQPADGWELICS